MNKNQFQQYIQDANFKNLFREIGWNNTSGQLSLNIEEASFSFDYIAQKNGFQVLTCKVDIIPSNTLCRKIDGKLRRFANDYICIFVAESIHHQWMVPIRTSEKRDITTIEYASLDQTDFLYSKLSRFSFNLEEETTIVEVKQRIQGVFSVNSERITKDFYTGFKKQHKLFADFISGIDDDIELKNNKNKQWYASVMLNRLMFCYFVQKKGFLNLDADYLQHKLKECQQKRGENKFFSTFYKGFLCQLFQGGLNSPQHNEEFEVTYGRIPYLNGGMFDQHELEKQYQNLDIEDEAFEKLFTFFDQWQWHLDTRITASGKDINPDVLGYIFEQYINDRAAMGAYYTKEDITGYIGKNCIIPFLMDKTQKLCPEAFVADGFVWKMLKESGDKYIYDAVKKGYSANWKQYIPDYIENGIDTKAPELLERRKRWNEKTSDEFALPTEIWRETIERLQRCENLLSIIRNGKIVQINDFITYNLDITRFAEDLIRNADNPNLVLHFYNALLNVTILDPTCGSGAFLFAALNVLEPLYEACLDRMEDFHAQNANLFKEELQAIKSKYRSNRQYFIYKSIILRNLYGVDIMVEATEIAKLRLFLKMVAVVEVDRRADNLGLDPLPDIDFNIKCGNTLVGYATKEDLEKDLAFANDILEELANQEFKEKIEEKMQTVAMAYELFRSEQLKTYDDNTKIKQKKNELKTELVELNDLLNRRLHQSSTQIGYDCWLSSHQPFHWLAEFYHIIQGNSGFDVIIGNPPYVVYTNSSFIYRVTGYESVNCGNLYAMCIERSYQILNSFGCFGMIVPISSVSADKMLPIQKKLVGPKNYCWTSSYSVRPAKLFNGAEVRLSIILSAPSKIQGVFSTNFNKWNVEYRPALFQGLQYFDIGTIVKNGSLPKISSRIALDILSKLRSISNSDLRIVLMPIKTNNVAYYFRAVQYWFKVLNKIPEFREDGIDKVTGEMKTMYFSSQQMCEVVTALLSSNLFFWFYVVWSSCQVVNSRDFGIPFDIRTMNSSLINELQKLSIKLQEDYQRHSKVVVRYYSKKKRNFTMEKQLFYIKYSKPIIDDIDNVLAKYYGFTEEELDFIINYDIKYRMGDELGNGEDEE